MRIILNLIVLAVQCVITFFTLLAIYMIFVVMDYQGGIDSFIGTTIIQPILGGLFSIMTIGICVLIGLPIRISETINIWWIKRTWLAIFALVLGLCLMTLSLLPSMRDTINSTIEDEIIQRQIPDPVFAICGWFVTAFSLLHLFPPYKLKISIERIVNKYVGKISN
jgi:hypothetical protein